MLSRRILLSLPLATPALAQAPWPSGPIRAVFPGGSDGPVDAVARVAAAKLQERLGVPVVPENRAGSALAVRDAPPDGHTLLFASSSLVMARNIGNTPDYDPIADFTPVARLARSPLLLITHPRAPQTTIAEVVAAARETPAAWRFGAFGPGTPGHLAAIEFKRRASLDIPITPYRNFPSALSDIAAGKIQVMFVPSFEAMPVVRGGQVRGLAIAQTARSPAAPDIASAPDSGMAGLDINAWYGVWGPKGLPPELVRRLNTAVNDGMNEPETVTRLHGLGFEPVSETPAAFADFIRAEVVRNKSLVALERNQPQ